MNNTRGFFPRGEPISVGAAVGHALPFMPPAREPTLSRRCCGRGLCPPWLSSAAKFAAPRAPAVSSMQAVDVRSRRGHGLVGLLGLVPVSKCRLSLPRLSFFREDLHMAPAAFDDAGGR